MRSVLSRFQILLLVLGATLLRLEAFRRPAGGFSTAEERLLETVASEGGAASSSAWVTLLSVLERFMPTPAITLANAPALPPDPDPLMGVARWLAVVLVIAAVALTASAARRLAGTPGAWLAGGLVALSPLALSLGASAGPGALHVFLAAGTLNALSRIRPGAPLREKWASALWVGAAVAAGGGGAGLAAGLVVAGTALPAWGLGALVLAGLAPGAAKAFPMLPQGSFGFPGPPAASPLLDGILVVAGAVGWPALAIAVPGKLFALTRRDDAGRAARAIVYATGGAFVVALLRGGPDPVALGSALPGLAVLAGLALASRRRAAGRAWAPAVLVLVTLLAPARTAWPTVAAPWRTDPDRAASAWIRQSVPSGTTLLSEEPRLGVPTPDGLAQLQALADSARVPRERLAEYSKGGRTFQVLPLPPRLRQPLERTLFYDPNLAGAFSYLVLRDLPAKDVPSPDAPRELLTARRLFHEYFRGAWEQVARFESSREGTSGLSIYRRPRDFQVDLEALGRLGFILVSEPMEKLRADSRRFTDWAMDAGLALRAEGDLGGARSFLGMVTERDPDRVEARFRFGEVLALRGQWDRAKAQLLAGMNLDPYHGGIHLQLGMILEQEGDATGALTEYRAAVNQLDEPSTARARLGALLHRTGDALGAREQLAELRAVSPRGEATRSLEALLGAP